MNMKKNATMYNNVEQVLKTSPHPMTINDLREAPSVAQVLSRSGQINDVVRGFHARGLVRKLPAVIGNQHLYEWIKGSPVKNEEPVSRLSPPAQTTPVRGEKVVLSKTIKPEIRIENNHIIVDHPQCRIIIELKGMS